WSRRGRGVALARAHRGRSSRHDRDLGRPALPGDDLLAAGAARLGLVDLSPAPQRPLSPPGPVRSGSLPCGKWIDGRPVRRVDSIGGLPCAARRTRSLAGSREQADSIGQRPGTAGEANPSPGAPMRWVELIRSEEHTSELQSRENLVCRLLLEKKKIEPGAAENLQVALRQTAPERQGKDSRLHLCSLQTMACSEFSESLPEFSLSYKLLSDPHQ